MHRIAEHLPLPWMLVRRSRQGKQVRQQRDIAQIANLCELKGCLNADRRIAIAQHCAGDIRRIGWWPDGRTGDGFNRVRSRIRCGARPDVCDHGSNVRGGFLPAL